MRAGRAAMGVAALALAAAVGAGAAWVATGRISSHAGTGPGGWRSGVEIGSRDASMYDRATIARVGIWALPPSETVYFSAVEDDAGQPLDPSCTYELAGKRDLPARWWSIAVYVGNHWAGNPRDRYTYTSTSTRRGPDGSFVIRVSRRPQPGNWLPLGTRDQPVTLTARLYNPAPGVADRPMAVPLPTIRRLECA